MAALFRSFVSHPYFFEAERLGYMHVELAHPITLIDGLADQTIACDRRLYALCSRRIHR